MDTSKLKVKAQALITSILSAAVIYAVFAGLCYGVYTQAHLQEIFHIAPTYMQWVSILFISSILFNEIPITWKQSN